MQHHSATSPLDLRPQAFWIYVTGHYGSMSPDVLDLGHQTLWIYVTGRSGSTSSDIVDLRHRTFWIYAVPRWWCVGPAGSSGSPGSPGGPGGTGTWCPGRADTVPAASPESSAPYSWSTEQHTVQRLLKPIDGQTLNYGSHKVSICKKSSEFLPWPRPGT